MSYANRVTEGMDVKNWPHQFTKKGNPVQIGQDADTHDPIIAVEMICVHCHAEYIAGKTARPPDPCPARTKQKELKRILS